VAEPEVDGHDVHEPLDGRTRGVRTVIEFSETTTRCGIAVLVTDIRTLTRQSQVRQEDLAPFSFQGSPVRLMATQQGIWKPRQLEAALSFRTVYARIRALGPMTTSPD